MSIEPTIGFLGLGRLGLPTATLLLRAGHAVHCCRRGHSRELVARGASVAGDGSPRAVAELADVLFTCVPADAIQALFAGPDGILKAPDPLPLVVELSTATPAEKQRLRDQVAARGGELLDCPVSGTPEMAARRAAVIYASGDRATYERVAGLLSDISPGVAYVGELGAGTRLKYVANLLVAVHVAATAEAMAFAETLSLDSNMVAETLARSPAATSGQFQFRAQMIAAGAFEGRLVTIRDIREVLRQIIGAATDSGATVPLVSTVAQLFDQYSDGHEDYDPGKLAWLLNHHSSGDVG